MSNKDLNFKPAHNRRANVDWKMKNKACSERFQDETKR